jgi:hypothetical protein
MVVEVVAEGGWAEVGWAVAEREKVGVGWAAAVVMAMGWG